MPQGFDRVHVGGAPGRVEAEHHAHCCRDPERQHYVLGEDDGLLLEPVGDQEVQGGDRVEEGQARRVRQAHEDEGVDLREFLADGDLAARVDVVQLELPQLLGVGQVADHLLRHDRLTFEQLHRAVSVAKPHPEVDQDADEVACFRGDGLDQHGSRQGGARRRNARP